MLVCLSVCLITAFVCSVHGQGGIYEICSGRNDFDPCMDDWTCDLKVSQCYCKSQTPFCRCNNYIDEFFLGKSCSQKWSTLTFALVATIPGVVLALMIGVAVHFAHRFGESSNNHRTGNELTVIPEQNLFPGVISASELMGPSHPSPVPVQVGVPMVSPQLYSVPDTHLAFERPLYSYTQGGAQSPVLSNPYAKARNPYEEHSVSPEPHFQTHSPHHYEDQAMAPPPAVSYGVPEYRSVLPRVQLSRPY